MDPLELARHLTAFPCTDGDLGPEMEDGDHGRTPITADDINAMAQELLEYREEIDWWRQNGIEAATVDRILEARLAVRKPRA